MPDISYNLDDISITTERFLFSTAAVEASLCFF